MRVGLRTAIALFFCGLMAGFFIQPVLIEERVVKEPVIVGEENVSLFFCPENTCSQRLIKFIESAEKSVHVMIYSLTKKEIAKALIKAKENGLEVRVVMDKVQAAGTHSLDELLVERGVKVKLVDPPGYGIMHHKVTIVDENSFSTGSFNYTENADSRNAENLLIVRKQFFAEKMEKEFQKQWKK